MSAVLVEIGADTAAFQKAVDGLPARMNASAGQMAAAMGKVSGSTNRAIGQMAMQVQDVVVQLQAGTKWTTVMAQQGSQMLSAFGTSGAIAGGLVAIGLAAYQMGERSKEAFLAAKKASGEFEASLGRMLASGDTSTLLSGFEGYQKQIDEAQRRLVGNNSGAEILGDVFSGVSREELDAQRVRDQQDGLRGMVEIEGRLLHLSDMEVKMAELRAAGRREEADEMERQLKLSQEIAKVRSYNLQPATKEKLVADLQRRDELQRPQSGSGMFASVAGSFAKIMPGIIEPVAEVIQAQIMERSQRLNSEASALRGAAFGGLRGDVDTSSGRGTSINPLNNGAARMVSELVKQSALLQQQARSMDRGNGYLQEIEKAVKKLNLGYQ